MTIEVQHIHVKHVTYVNGVENRVNLSWGTSNPAVAAVSQLGVVSIPGSVKSGSALITATAANGRQMAVTVNVAKKAVKLTGASVKAPTKMTVGQEYRLAAKPSPSKATGVKVTSKSSKPRIIYVDAASNMRALAKGKCTITTKIGARSVKRAITVR